jgi:hypothetical protein
VAAKEQDWLVAYTIHFGKAEYFAVPLGNQVPGSSEAEAAREAASQELPLSGQGTEQIVRATSVTGALRSLKAQVESTIRAVRQFSRLYQQRYNSNGTMTEIRPFANDLFVVLRSYSTPVAALIGDELVRTSQRYSVTTSKHLSTWHPPGRAAGFHRLAEEQFFRVATEGIVETRFLEPPLEGKPTFSREDVLLLMTAFPDKVGALVVDPPFARAEIERARERVPRSVLEADEAVLRAFWRLL